MSFWALVCLFLRCFISCCIVGDLIAYSSEDICFVFSFFCSSLFQGPWRPGMYILLILNFAITGHRKTKNNHFNRRQQFSQFFFYISFNCTTQFPLYFWIFLFLPNFFIFWRFEFSQLLAEWKKKRSFFPIKWLWGVFLNWRESAYEPFHSQPSLTILSLYPYLIFIFHLLSCAPHDFIARNIRQMYSCLTIEKALANAKRDVS